MWKRTVCTHLDRFAVFLHKSGIARTLLPVVQRAIAEQTVKLVQSFMAGEIFTLCIFEETM